MGTTGRQGTSPRRARIRIGFTLIEVLLTTVIVVTGVTATVLLLATGRVANADSAAISNAVQLAENIRELTLRLRFQDEQDPWHFGPEAGETFATFDDVDDLNGFSSDSLGGPVDGRRQVLADQARWVQQVAVETVDQNHLTESAKSGSQPLVRVTVTVKRNGETVHRARWLAGTSR